MTIKTTIKKYIVKYLLSVIYHYIFHCLSAGDTEAAVQSCPQEKMF